MKNKTFRYVTLFSLVLGTTTPLLNNINVYADEEEVTSKVETVADSEQELSAENENNQATTDSNQLIDSKENESLSGEAAATQTSTEEQPLLTESQPDTSTPAPVQTTAQISIQPRSTNDFNISSNGTTVGFGSFDLANEIYFSDYSGDLGTPVSYTWELVDSNNNSIDFGSGVYSLTGNTISINTVEKNAEYTLYVTVNTGRVPDSLVVHINQETVEAMVSVDKYENPTEIKVWAENGDGIVRTDAETTWTILKEDGSPAVDGNGNPITGIGNTVPNDVINSLPNGKYSVVNNSSDLTKFGSTGPSMLDTISAPFEITGGKVTTHHITRDINGNETEFDIIVDAGKVGESWTAAGTPNTSIPEGYKLVQGPVDIAGNPIGATGIYSKDSDDHVYYYYELIKTNVVIEYVDAEGNPVSNPSNPKQGSYGENYDTEPAVIPGYTFKEVSPTGDTATGTYGSEDKKVIYVYEKNPADLIVYFIDEHGNKLALDQTQAGFFSDPYQTNPAEIPGYELITTQGKPNGEYGTTTTEVTYVYKLKAPIVNDVVEGSEFVDGTGTPGMNVIVTFPDGSKVTVLVDQDGNWSAKVPDGVYLVKGDQIPAVTSDPAFGTTSEVNVGKVTPVNSTLPNEKGKGTNHSSTNKPAASKTTNPAQETNKPTTVLSNTNTTSASNKKLPSTGETSNVLQSQLMLVLISLLGASLALFKKKSEDLEEQNSN